MSVRDLSPLRDPHNLGGYSGGETPLPIPNREVKPVSADGTRGAIPRESRTPPISLKGPAEGLNFSVRNGKRCFPLAMTTGNLSGSKRGLARPSKLHRRFVVFSKSSPRMISTGLLNALLRLHIPPINLVVFQDPYSLEGMGELISRWASRLDAFSGYPVQT